MIEKIFEMIYWIKILLSPILIGTLILIILSSIFGFDVWFCLIYIPSLVVGVIMAERIRKKYGTSNYWSKTMNTPDIKETWESEEENKSKSIH